MLVRKLLYWNCKVCEYNNKLRLTIGLLELLLPRRHRHTSMGRNNYADCPSSVSR